MAKQLEKRLSDRMQAADVNLHNSVSFLVGGTSTVMIGACSRILNYVESRSGAELLVHARLRNQAPFPSIGQHSPIYFEFNCRYRSAALQELARNAAEMQKSEV